MKVLAILYLALAYAQPIGELQYQYLCTYGSKHGIHPPRVLNKRPARTALGDDEHPYGLGFPAGVVADKRRRIWIADSGTASVHVFDTESKAYREIRRAGDVALQQPSGLATDRQGYVYLTDSATGGFYAFDPSGEYDRSIIKKNSGRVLEGPTAIAVSEDGFTLFVADPPRKVIVAFNREGEETGRIGSAEVPIDALAISVVGNEIYALDRQRRQFLVFSIGGLFRREAEWDGIRMPSAFAYDKRRRLFFVANPRWMVIDIFSDDGRNLGAFGQLGDAVQQMKGIDAMYVDPDGVVYAVDSHQGKVLVFAEISPGASKHVEN